MRVNFYFEPEAAQDSSSYPSVRLNNVPEEVAHEIVEEFSEKPSGIMHKRFSPTDGGPEESFAVPASEIVFIKVVEDPNRGL